jgi:hypothetical protein
VPSVEFSMPQSTAYLGSPRARLSNMQLVASVSMPYAQGSFGQPWPTRWSPAVKEML